MAVNVGNLEATLGMDTKGFKDGVKEAEKGTKGIGASLSSLKVPLLAVGAALVGLGAASLSAWTEIDESLDNIRVGTGATGEALAGLEDSFKAVFSSVPVDAADASTAIADLNTRLGITGKDLEILATQFLELSRITETNVAGNIKSVTRLFGDFSVATKDQADTLDYLFKTAQATGATVEQLSTRATQYGTALRAMGFDLKTSIALLGKFEKEGVNTETILASLKIGMSNMAREGVTDAKEALKLLIDEIKSAPSNIDATAKAIEVFGSRAAADMTMAIREGRFEVEDFISTLSDSDETILKAADDTRDFAEQFKVLNNKITLALEPLGAMLAGIISTDIIPALDSIMEWWDNNGQTTFDTITNAVQWLKDTFQPFIDMYLDFWGNQAQKMTDFWNEDGALVMAALENIRKAFQIVIEYIAMAWEWLWPYLENIIGPAVDVILDLVGVFAAIFAGDWETLKDKLIDLSLDLMDLMYGVFELGFDAVLGLFVAIGNGINAVLTGAWNMVLGGLEAMINKAIDMLNRMIAAMNKIPGVNIPLIGKVSFERAEAKTLEAPKLSDFTGGAKPTDKIRAQIEADRPAKEKETKEVAKQTATEIAKEMAKTKPVVPKPSEMPPNKPVEIVTDKPIRVEGITENAFKDLTAELKMFSFESIVDAINNARDMLIAAITPKEETEVSEEEEITPATLGEKISQALSETFTNMSANGADFDVDTMSNMPLILNQDIHITTEIDGYEIGKAVYSTWNKRTGGGLNII